MLNLRHIFRRRNARQKICITTYFDNKFGAIGELCYKSILIYAKRHEQEAVLLHDIESDRPLPWHKILVIQRLFAAGYDYVFWVDADAVFVEYDRDIAAELEEGKDLYLVKHSIDSKDVPNTGIMVMKNSDWSRNVLDMIWSKDEFTDHKWWENAALIDLLGYHDLLEQDRPNRINQDLAGKIKWLRPAWNSMPGICEAKHPIIHHYAGRSLEYRFEHMTDDFRRYSIKHMQNELKQR